MHANQILDHINKAMEDAEELRRVIRTAMALDAYIKNLFRLYQTTNDRRYIRLVKGARDNLAVLISRAQILNQKLDELAD